MTIAERSVLASQPIVWMAIIGGGSYMIWNFQEDQLLMRMENMERCAGAVGMPGKRQKTRPGFICKTCI